MMIVTRALLVVIVLASPAARAQTAEAETLFREGKKLMKKGEIAEACEKFDASERLEPGIGTELNLGDCREKNGQIASAWAMFVKAASSAKRVDDTKREGEARRRAEALEAQLVYLTVTVPEEARVDGLVIKRNKTTLDPALWDQKVPVDSGEYLITADAPGRVAWKTTVEVRTKNKKLEVPVLDKDKDAEPEPKVSKKKQARDDDESEDDSRSSRPPPPPPGMTGARKLAIVLGITAIAAAGTGLGLGYHAQSLESDSDKLCPTTACTDPMGVSLNSSARSYGLYANIGYIAGGALAVTAVTLWIMGRPGERTDVAVVPALGADHVGLAVGGAF